MTGKRRLVVITLLFFLIMLLAATAAKAEPLPIPNVDFNIRQTDNPQEVVDTVQLLAALTILALAPAILIMMTSFTRIIVVFAFLRNALATQQTPPNQILVGLALFLTFFIMAPVYQDINENALTPYLAGSITQEEALSRAQIPLKEFMFKQTREKDLALFVNAAKMEKPENRDAVPISVLIPAFVISELKTAFTMGFIIFIPFLIIDMVVASTLMSMGMFMVPPVMISLPFKLLLFVMVDGWYLVVKTLLESFG